MQPSNSERHGSMDEIARVFQALHPTVAHDGARTVASFTPHPEHRGNVGWLHGGMAATVLDHVSARSAANALGRHVVTGRLDLRYRHPVSLEAGPYQVVATASPPKRQTVRISAAILDDKGRALVQASSLFIVRPDQIEPDQTAVSPAKQRPH